MDHMTGLQPVTPGDLGAAGVAAAERFAFRQQLWPRRAMNGAIHTTAAEQAAIGGIHNGVDIKRGDVGDNNVEDRLSDLGCEFCHAARLYHAFAGSAVASKSTVERTPMSS